MKPFSLLAPAKINIFLRVINKRADGYHNLKTLFERIDLADEIHFASNPSGRITLKCQHAQVPLGPKNLIQKAAAIIKSRYPVKEGADITIVKRIPVAAGLAGGSSNGATALLGFNRLWSLGLNQNELLDLGRQLGSDVPFFLHNCRWGLGTQRGDKIQPLEIPAQLWHVLVVPRVKMYSREVFAHHKLELTKKSDNANILIRYLKNKNIIKLKSLLFNDLEKSILGLCPSLRNVQARMKELDFQGVSFSGSGPSIFGITESQAQAEELKSFLSRIYSQVFAVRTF
jgi:4-diphosphocytidyl-2-C-methyl-D-erythritol kinase